METGIVAATGHPDIGSLSTTLTSGAFPCLMIEGTWSFWF